MTPPRHVAVIPDGNRRWARARGYPLTQGYREGAARFRELIKTSFESGVSYLTIWAASESNLTSRSPAEVASLQMLIHKELEALVASEELRAREVRVRIIGRAAVLLGDPTIQARIDGLQASTAHHKNYHLTILLGYDGRTEMLEAVRALGARASEATPELLKRGLWTGDLPPVDLVIRTGGEPHWSAGFLMWLTAESQLVFRDMLWPEFDSAALAAAFTEYASRGRRFGA